MANSRLLQEKAQNRPRYTPVRVLGLFFIALLAAAIMAQLQHRERRLLESTEAPTAVGDRAYYVLRRPFVAKVPVAALSGPLFLQAFEPVTRNDAEMRKVAWWRRYHIYRDREGSSAGPHYVKTGKGRYLPLGPKPLAEPSPTDNDAAPPVSPAELPAETAG